VHYVRHEDAEPHDALLCIQTGAKIADANRMRFSGTQFYLKSAAEMARLFAEIPESFTNTLAVAEMCDLSIPFPKGSERYPKYPLTPEISARFDRPGYLHQLCCEGLQRRYGHDFHALAARPIVAERLARLTQLAPGQKPSPPDHSAARPRGAPRGPHGLRARDHPGHRLRRLLPRGRGLHRLGEAAGHARRCQAAVPAPAVSSRT
jgi:DNA polymerase-3 subunit alpha